ncbi:hypothetical protein, partial [Prescottella equi]|uniref:hypothetical protein n=1 Tax=Rhodococcus hoagii TaxID=43767 RepID=UPI001C92EA8F
MRDRVEDVVGGMEKEVELVREVNVGGVVGDVVVDGVEEEEEGVGGYGDSDDETGDAGEVGGG